MSLKTKSLVLIFLILALGAMAGCRGEKTTAPN